jgi:hypothetical protein
VSRPRRKGLRGLGDAKGKMNETSEKERVKKKKKKKRKGSTSTTEHARQCILAYFIRRLD